MDCGRAQPLSCLRCGKNRGFFSSNYAGLTFFGIKYPGNTKTDYLCTKCQQALKPELMRQQLEQDGGIKKPRERAYMGLNLPRALVVQEVKSYLDVNRYFKPEIKEEEARTIVTGGDLAVIVSGSPDQITVAAGPRAVLLDATQTLSLSFLSPVFAIAKGIGVAWDKHKVDRFFEHLDRTLYARAGLTSSNDPPASGIADKIRELGKLRDEGLLSDEEFQTKKAALLARM
jgi:hypothetical protein